MRHLQQLVQHQQNCVNCSSSTQTSRSRRVRAFINKSAYKPVLCIILVPICLTQLFRTCQIYELTCLPSIFAAATKSTSIKHTKTTTTSATYDALSSRRIRGGSESEGEYDADKDEQEETIREEEESWRSSKSKINTGDDDKNISTTMIRTEIVWLLSFPNSVSITGMMYQIITSDHIFEID